MRVQPGKLYYLQNITIFKLTIVIDINNLIILGNTKDCINLDSIKKNIRTRYYMRIC